MASDIKSTEDLRGMDRTKLKAFNKDGLIDIILTIMDKDAQPPAYDDKIKQIASDIADLKQMMTSPDSPVGRKFAEMQQTIDKQAQAIMQQQRFLEELDRRSRETKMVILGVPEDEPLQGATRDEEKLQKIWGKMEEPLRITSHRRLGRQNDARKRPILVTVDSKDVRDAVVSKGNKLKDAGDAFRRIYVKRDEHPTVRNEWKRLRAAEAAEKERPENLGCSIRLDMRERCLYKDGVIIDRWNPHPF